MPPAQVMSGRLNSHFTRERVRELSADSFAPGADLARLAFDNHIAKTDLEKSARRGLSSRPRGPVPRANLIRHGNSGRFGHPFALFRPPPKGRSIDTRRW
jgi:hypothetical protein